tara:strand:+ start:25 stop:378 length:354 start_codon:yes stop_codon:yes gene_type:complete
MAENTNTYSWNCRTVDCYPTYESDSDVVYNIHWRYSATSSVLNPNDNPYVSAIIGTQSISTEDITDFIPFADLTNEIVTEWCETTMGEETLASMKTNVDAQIESQINPTSVTLQVKE